MTGVVDVLKKLGIAEKDIADLDDLPQPGHQLPEQRRPQDPRRPAPEPMTVTVRDLDKLV